MKILHVCYSDTRGGAAKACYRTHKTLINNNINSEIVTCLKPKSNDNTVFCYCNSLLKQIWRKLVKMFFLAIVMVFQKTKNQNLHTLDVFSVINPKFLNNHGADIIHLHWVNYSMLSIRSISKIKKPVIWTFHDAYPFMGCEHHDDLNFPCRYKNDYSKSSKNVKFLDLNRFSWKLKKKYWNIDSFDAVTPSLWMKKCAEESSLLKNFKIHHIPNTLDSKIFTVKDKFLSRSELNLPIDKKLVLFGAADPDAYIKGGDLLFDAMSKFKEDDVEFVVFGTPSQTEISGIKTHYTGFINSEETLSKIYNACDVMIVPSRQDNLPNTVLESIACGTPVVAFNIGGIPDMVLHLKTGYLAKPYNTDDLLAGIDTILNNPKNVDFSTNCINHFNSNFSEDIIAGKLIDLYKSKIQYL